MVTFGPMIEIGSPTAVTLFRTRHAAFFAGSAALHRALSLAFDRAFNATDPVGSVIFFLGSRCADDFREVLLLAAHGQGWGATAHVRGMFERCVTAAYLHENPEYVQDFIDYDYIRRSKTARAIEKITELTPEQKEGNVKLQEAAERVKSRFMVPICDTCKTERVNHTWSRLDVVAMAGKIEKIDPSRQDTDKGTAGQPAGGGSTSIRVSNGAGRTIVRARSNKPERCRGDTMKTT